MGVCLGVGVGYIIALVQCVHRMGTDKEGEVVLGIAALRKLETNDTAGAKNVLHWVVADDYLDQIQKKEPWWFQAANYNPNLEERVEKAARDLPGLEAAIEERKKKKSDQQDGGGQSATQPESK